jgi:hypothetical protein
LIAAGDFNTNPTSIKEGLEVKNGQISLHTGFTTVSEPKNLFDNVVSNFKTKSFKILYNVKESDHYPIMVVLK